MNKIRQTVSSDATWHNVQYVPQTIGKVGEFASVTISHCCIQWKLVLNSDFAWFYVEEGAADKHASNTVTRMWCANC